LGKISDALGKYVKEQRTIRRPQPSRDDLGVVFEYNRKTGHFGADYPKEPAFDIKHNQAVKTTPIKENVISAGFQPDTENPVFKNDKPAAIRKEMKPAGNVSLAPEKKVDKKDIDHASQNQPVAAWDDNLHDKRLISLVDPQSHEAEQFKILRNNILFPVAGTAPQSILVTSSLPAEGKTFVAANLAISIAMNVKTHVLLIDCDLRKPDLHRMFGFDDGPGLSDYLAEERSLPSLLLRTRVERLSLLPGGPIPPNPSELMSSERMAAMLQEVKLRYSDRLIVIDSPPPGLAAETSYLARQADGILLVVEYGKTPREDVEDLMAAVGTKKILGTVLNHLDMPISKRNGYGRYGKYGRYQRYRRVK
jgi:exopolysaccharide/PEP-CTERM locus tyrosine autokinase